MDKTIVEISGLSKTFKDVKAVKDLSLTVFEKDIYGFLGPNGSGKSTSIRMMLSLIRPDEGSIKIFGQDLQKHRNNILVKMGAFVEKADFYEHLSARRNLELLARYSGVNISDKRYEEVLDLVGLSSRSGSKVKTYSKGMKQRLGIAQALLHEPELLVLDEPASGLDPSGMRDIRELIRFLNEEKQITIILSSHNLQEIELIAKRMIIINKGVKIVEGHVHELLQQYNYFTVFNLNDAKKGWNILKESQIPFEKADTDSSNLRILCQRNEVSRINELFVENGLEIYGIKTEQNLEDYFFEPDLMLKLINIELYKIFTQKRSYIGLAAILVIVLVAQGAMLWEGQAMHEFITKNLSDAFFMYGNLVNGYLISFLVLNFLWVHVPLLVVIVTGDIFSGEAQSGTFRLLLTRPVSRSGLVTAKFIAGIVYTFVLMIFFAIISLGISLIWFGKGDLMVIFNSVSILPEDDLLWRFILAYVYGFIGMTAIAALSMLFSAMANNSLGPILTTMAIIILFTMISSFNLSIFAAIQPFLITSYLDSWQLVFSFEVDTGQIIFDASVLLLHILVFYFITLVYFNRKDILT